VVKIQVKVFWFLMLGSVRVGYQRFGGLSCLLVEDGGSTVLQNTGILTQYYMGSQPRRP
jgi:hypothetical protein